MKCKVLLLICVLLLSFNMTHASSVHKTNVIVPGYVSINVSGSASVFVTSDDFINRINEKVFDSDVQLKVKSNQNCRVQVSGVNFAPGFPIGYVQTRINRQGNNYIPLAASGVNLISLTGKQDNIYNVVFKLTNIQQLATLNYDTYSTTISYTAFVNQ